MKSLFLISDMNNSLESFKQRLLNHDVDTILTNDRHRKKD